MQFDKLDLTPRKFARMIKSAVGSYPNPDKKLITPTPFSKERAQEIYEHARKDSIGPWTDRCNEFMTDGELVYVRAVWDCLDGSSSWCNAFMHIQQGTIEAYQNAIDKLD